MQEPIEGPCVAAEGCVLRNYVSALQLLGFNCFFVFEGPDDFEVFYFLPVCGVFSYYRV